MTLSKATPQGIAEAVSYAASNGIVVSQSKHSAAGTNIAHAPMTYLPSPLHAPSYRHGLRIAPALNRMLARIAADHAYLRSVLEETAAADADFTGRLLSLLPSAGAERAGVEIGLFRFDYFVHQEEGKRSLRMVEMNCIAASFACLGTKTSQMHRYLAENPSTGQKLDVSALPPNDAMAGMARGIAQAHLEYVKLYGEKSAMPCVTILVVQPGERNAYDQYLLRMALWDAYRVDMVPMTLRQIDAFGTLDEDGQLSVTLPDRDGETVQVSVVYYRAGYSPDDYPSDKEWNARAMMEKSAAANCPSVAMQLVGTKKIQQVLDKPGEVERFVDSKEDAADIRATFARQYSLSAAEDGEKIAQMGIDRPEDFVLKPQREGGGNNLYSNELKTALQSMSAEERSAFVLMERIRPVIVQNVLIRDGEHRVADIVSEFGVFGVHVSKSGEEVASYTAGTLLRSKVASQDDGGVAAGVAVLDSPLLVE